MAMFKSLQEALTTPELCTVLKLTVKSDELPRELLALPELTELHLEAPLLSRLPELAGHFRKLRLLSLKAPKGGLDVSSLFFLPKLENLKIIETPLGAFRMTLGQYMAPLKSLTLKSCSVTVLPLEIGEFGSLAELSLPDNHLEALPFTFVTLKTLRRLNLDGHAFTQFPDILRQLTDLQHLSLDGNRFSATEKARIQRQFNITPN